MLKSFLIKRIIRKIKTKRHHFLYDAEKDCVIEEIPFGKAEIWNSWVFVINHLDYVI